FTGGALAVGVRPQSGALGRLLHDKLGVVVEVVVGIFVDHDAGDRAGLVPAGVDQVFGDFAKTHVPVNFGYRELGAIKDAAVEGGVHFATGGEHGRSPHAVKQARLVAAALAQTQTFVVVKRTNGFVGALAGLGRGDRVGEPFQAVLGVELVDQLVTATLPVPRHVVAGCEDDGYGCGQRERGVATFPVAGPVTAHIQGARLDVVEHLDRR